MKSARLATRAVWLILAITFVAGHAVLLGKVDRFLILEIFAVAGVALLLRANKHFLNKRFLIYSLGFLVNLFLPLLVVVVIKLRGIGDVNIEFDSYLGAFFVAGLITGSTVAWFDVVRFRDLWRALIPVVLTLPALSPVIYAFFLNRLFFPFIRMGPDDWYFFVVLQIVFVLPVSFLGAVLGLWLRNRMKRAAPPDA